MGRVITTGKVPAPAIATSTHKPMYKAVLPVLSDKAIIDKLNVTSEISVTRRAPNLSASIPITGAVNRLHTV